jgi:allophanate hydrolase subunit 2
MGSFATNSVAHLGGLEGRALKAGDVLSFGGEVAHGMGGHPRAVAQAEGPIRVTWGLHADLFTPGTRERFAREAFAVSPRIDRMGARLTDASGVFASTPPLSLVSDAIVPGDIQILGDGTPIVLLRDHQPTGGYPRIATVISADLDRFAQLRPGAAVRFEPVTLAHAHAILAGTR